MDQRVKWSALACGIATATTASIILYKTYLHQTLRGRALLAGQSLTPDVQQALRGLAGVDDIGADLTGAEPDINGPAVSTQRRLRYVVIAGRNRFGDPIERSVANRIIVDRWVRRYMAGKEEGSPLKMEPARIAHWAPLVVTAILTPSAAAVAAAVAQKSEFVQEALVSVAEANRPTTLLDIFLGLRPWRTYGALPFLSA